MRELDLQSSLLLLDFGLVTIGKETQMQDTKIHESVISISDKNTERACTMAILES